MTGPLGEVKNSAACHCDSSRAQQPNNNERDVSRTANERIMGEVKTKVEGKPAEVKAVSTHCDVPYIPRRIDRLPPDLNKLKK